MVYWGAPRAGVNYLDQQETRYYEMSQALSSEQLAPFLTQLARVAELSLLHTI